MLRSKQCDIKYIMQPS